MGAHKKGVSFRQLRWPQHIDHKENDKKAKEEAARAWALWAQPNSVLPKYVSLCLHFDL